jgi:inhibitor of KinA
MQNNVQIVSLGDGVLLIQWQNRIDDSLNSRVLQLYSQLRSLSSFIVDVVPAYSSLAVYYDVVMLHTAGKTAFEVMKEHLQPLLTTDATDIHTSGAIHRIPVCYESKFAPDLAELATAKKLAEEEVIRLHTGHIYRVYMIGFLPGFPYMGKVDSRIAAPRRSNPRTNITAGSVGIAGEQTGIYPLSSPGGWNIIGRTPLQLFNKERVEPVLLQPGDSVQFYSITEDEFNDQQSRLA